MYGRQKNTYESYGNLMSKSSLLVGGYWGFHRGKPVPFANWAPSWILEARAPGYERASVKIAGGGVAFLSTIARPAPPRRSLPKMAATKSEHRVFSPKKNSNAYR